MIELSEDDVVKELKKRNPGSKGFKFQGKAENVLGGTVMAFESIDEDDAAVEDYVYIHENNITAYNSVIDLAQGIKQHKKVATIDRFMSFSGISGLIALVLLLVISILVVSGKGDSIPDIITTSFGLVIGFYFGQQHKSTS